MTLEKIVDEQSIWKKEISGFTLTDDGYIDIEGTLYLPEKEKKTYFTIEEHDFEVHFFGKDTEAEIEEYKKIYESTKHKDQCQSGEEVAEVVRVLMEKVHSAENGNKQKKYFKILNKKGYQASDIPLFTLK